MPTIEQIRAARALLDWSQSDLADHAGLSQTGIARIENGTNKPNSSTLEKIRNAFDAADIEFLGSSGVRKTTGEIRTLKGQDGFRNFMDDVYNVAKAQGGEICLHNAKTENWYKWLGKEWYLKHSERMTELGNTIEVKITTVRGNTLLIANQFAEYRWISEELFNEQSFYAYGNKLALLNFTEDTVSVLVLNNKDFARGFRALFNVAWENATTIPTANKKDSAQGVN